MSNKTDKTKQFLSTWHSLKPQNNPAPQENEILVYGPIVSEEQAEFYRWFYGTGYAISPKSFRERLAEIQGEDVVLRINSPGGNVAATSTIRSLILQAQADGKTIHTIIDGMAASGASILALSAPKENRQIAELGQVFIHNAQILIDFWVRGDWEQAEEIAEEAQQIADELKELDKTILELYQKETTIKKDQLKRWLSQEKTLSSKQALEFGFATSYYQGSLPANHADEKLPPIAYKATASGGLQLDRFFPQPEPQEETQPPPTKEAIMPRTHQAEADSRVAAQLKLPTGTQVTDEHRDQAIQEMAAQQDTDRRALLEARVDNVLDRHAQRVVITAQELTEHRTQILAAADPDWALSFLDKTLSSLLKPIIAETAIGHTETPPAPGKEIPQAEKSQLFRNKVKELENGGLSFGDALLHAKHQLGDDFYEAYAYHTHETTGTPGVAG